MYYECYMGTSPFCVIETQMHNMLQSASFTVRIYEPDIYNLNISSNIHQGHIHECNNHICPEDTKYIYYICPRDTLLLCPRDTNTQNII